MEEKTEEIVGTEETEVGEGGNEEEGEKGIVEETEIGTGRKEKKDL